jgi:hypothetical protein
MRHRLHAPYARWLPTRQLVSWSAKVLGWSLLVAALALLLTLLAMQVTEVGPYGRVIFVAASLAVVARMMPAVARITQRTVGRVRLRFGLRTLFLAVAVSGITLAWVGNLIRDVQHQRQILDGAFSRGYAVTFDDRVTPWMYRRFGMNWALALRALDYVSMERRTSALRGEDFEALTGLRYKRLSLNYCLVTDDEFVHLKPFSELKHFNAQGTRLSDKAIQYLAQFQDLEDIDIQKTKVTDEGISHLVRLDKLRSAILINTPITDRSVATLKLMKQLRYLFVQGTSITPEGVAELRLALPKCDVDDSSACKYPPYYYGEPEHGAGVLQ